MIRNILLNTGSSIVYFFLQWLTTVLAVRLGSFETAGNYALAISFTTLFYCVALFGIRNYQIGDAEKHFSDGQYFAARLIAAFVATALFVAVVGKFVRTQYALACYGVYMLFKIGEVFTEGYFSILQIYSNYSKLALTYTIKGVVSCAAFSIPLAMTHDLLTAVIWMTVGYWVCVFLLDIPHLVSMKLGRPVFHGCAGILLKCVPLMLVSQSTAVMNYITRNAIDLELNSYLLGQYSSLSSVITVMSTFAVTVFVVIVPRIGELKQRGQWGGMLHLCGRSLMAMLLLGVAAVAAVQFLGRQVCQAIFGEAILENFDMLLPLTVTAIVLMCKLFFSSILIPLDRRWSLLIGEACGVAVCALFAIPLTRRFGMQGANASYLAGVVLQLLIMAICTVWTIFENKRAAVR